MKKLRRLKRLLTTTTDPFKWEDDPVVAATVEHWRRIFNSTEGFFHWDVKKGEVLWSMEMFKLLGLSRQEPLTFGAWKRHARAEDIPAAQKALNSTLTTGRPLLMAVRFKNRSHWIVGLGGAITGRNGKVRRICGVAFELTNKTFPCLRTNGSVKRLRLKPQAG